MRCQDLLGSWYVISSATVPAPGPALMSRKSAPELVPLVSRGGGVLHSLAVLRTQLDRKLGRLEALTVRETSLHHGLTDFILKRSRYHHSTYINPKEGIQDAL